MDWFLYDRDFRHEIVKQRLKQSYWQQNWVKQIYQSLWICYQAVKLTTFLIFLQPMLQLYRVYKANQLTGFYIATMN